MSRLRDLLQATKEEDPARNITVSVPSSLLGWIEKIMSDTGLGRSTVVKALLQDGLIEYLNSPIRDAFPQLRSKTEEPNFSGYFEFCEIAEALGEEFAGDLGFHSEMVFDSDFVFSTLREKMELNKKVVMG